MRIFFKKGKQQRKRSEARQGKMGKICSRVSTNSYLSKSLLDYPSGTYLRGPETMAYQDPWVSSTACLDRPFPCWDKNTEGKGGGLTEHVVCSIEKPLSFPLWSLDLLQCRQPFSMLEWLGKPVEGQNETGAPNACAYCSRVLIWHWSRSITECQRHFTTRRKRWYYIWERQFETLGATKTKGHRALSIEERGSL